MKKTETPVVLQEEMGAALPKRSYKKVIVVFSFAILIFASLVILLLFRKSLPEENVQTYEEEEYVGVDNLPTWVQVELLSVDGASRRGEKLEAVRDIAVHYVGNPGSSAMANRNYFNSPDSTTSSHFIVGLEGEVILCIPLDEKSSATNERNRDTISIEVCHPDESGKFSDVTRNSLIRLLAFLCEKLNLTEEDLIRHYDVTGKLCPLYYVENESEWLLLKADVKRALEGEVLWEE